VNRAANKKAAGTPNRIAICGGTPAIVADTTIATKHTRKPNKAGILNLALPLPNRGRRSGPKNKTKDTIKSNSFMSTYLQLIYIFEPLIHVPAPKFSPPVNHPVTT